MVIDFREMAKDVLDMAFLPLLAYIFCFLIRPQDWWSPIIGFPVDDLTISLIFLSLMSSYSKLPKIWSFPQSKFIVLFSAVVWLSNLGSNDSETFVEYGVKYTKFTILYFAICLRPIGPRVDMLYA